MKTVYIKATLLDKNEDFPVGEKAGELGMIYIKEDAEKYFSNSYQIGVNYGGEDNYSGYLPTKCIINQVEEKIPDPIAPEVIQQGLSFGQVLQLVAVTREPELVKTLI